MIVLYDYKSYKRQFPPISLTHSFIRLKYQTYMEAESNTKMKKILLIVNCMILSIGNAGGPLISRLYFIHGGKRPWFSSFLQTAGWPMILIPLFISYIQRRKTQGSEAKLLLIKPISFLAFLIIGLLTGLDDYFYACGVARLPVSTTSLIIASQLAFTAGFAFLLVKQKFTPYSINAVVLLTIGASILAFHSSSDRPNGESKKEYIKGFLLTLAASCLYGFILPSIELSNKKAKQDLTYSFVLESQMVMCFFATAFCALGMLINNDFQAISREAREFELGETKYYVIIVWNAILWQAFFLGAIGVIFCASSLLSGIMISVLLPVVEILAVIFYDEKFQVEKGVALVLSLWGFISYFYGEIKYNKKQRKQIQDTEVPHIPTP